MLGVYQKSSPSSSLSALTALVFSVYSGLGDILLTVEASVHICRKVKGSTILFKFSDVSSKDQMMSPFSEEEGTWHYHYCGVRGVNLFG